MTGLLVRKLQQTQTYSDITKCQSRLPYTEILKFSMQDHAILFFAHRIFISDSRIKLFPQY